MIIIIRKIKENTMKKYSKQRELILESLKHRNDHPTAEKLFMDLKKEMPELGIATVYRNLTDLCEDGQITKIKSKVGPDRYDGNQAPHIHFECKKCGNLMDICLEDKQIEQINKMLEEFSKDREIKYENSEIYLNGLCKKCGKSIAII